MSSRITVGTYADLWKIAEPQASTVTVASIEEGLEMARLLGQKNGGMETLITGSLYLVGGALNLLCPCE